MQLVMVENDKNESMLSVDAFEIL